MNRRINVKNVLVVACLTIIIAFGYFIFFKRYQGKDRNADFTPAASPTEMSPKIIYQQGGDSSGRTTLYEYNKGFSGIGRKTSGYSVYIAGVFDRWESIGGSADRYMYINDPNSGQLLSKIRVIYEEQEYEYTYRLLTSLLQEDISNIANLPANTKVVNYLKNIVEDELTALIKSGDAVIVTPLTKFRITNKPEDVDITYKDQNGAEIASAVFIRRYGK